MRTEIITEEKMKWINRFYRTIYDYYCKGNDRVYQWKLENELRFLKYIKTAGEYTFEDADKLNSIKSLYTHIKNGTVHEERE